MDGHTGDGAVLPPPQTMGLFEMGHPESCGGKNYGDSGCARMTTVVGVGSFGLRTLYHGE